MESVIDSEIIKNKNDVFVMLDKILEKRDNEWWDKFYIHRGDKIPFFKNVPDENLITYIENKMIIPGRSLDIGCGNGRNSIYLAKSDFDVYGIDFSNAAIQAAKDMAVKESTKVDFMCDSIFNFKGKPESFDFIYDSGCLHHIKPHRRNEYLDIVSKYLKPNGYFGMVCFNLKGGANISDYDVYRDYSMQGGLGFSEYKLRTILESYFEIVEFREMKDSDVSVAFGKSILWTILMKKK